MSQHPSSPPFPHDAAGLASGMMPPPLRLALHRVNGRRVQGAAVALPEEGAVLGSAPLRELLGLHADASLHIARNHARIMPLCGHWMLSLADEHMVCAVNGSKVPWGELYTLAPGDSIQLGFTELRVESAESASLAEVGLFAAATAEASAQGASYDVLQAGVPSAAQAYLPDSVDSTPMSVEEASASLSFLCLGEAGDADALCGDAEANSALALNAPAVLAAESPPADRDEDAGLSPEAALLQQLGTDFAASPTSHALHYQSGQPLDAILAPVMERPELTGLISLLPEEAPSPSASAQPPHAATAGSLRTATTGMPLAALAAVSTDQDFFAQLAQPQPLHSVLSPPSFSVREEAPTPDAPSLAELLDTQDAARTLEDILDGPLQIDDVLRSLEETASTPPDATFTLLPTPATQTAPLPPATPFTLDVLQQEIPPDPLTLLGGAGAATASPSAPLSAWDADLSPLLRREHHQADLHTPYTLANAAQALPKSSPTIPPKVPHDKEPA